MSSGEENFGKVSGSGGEIMTARRRLELRRMIISAPVCTDAARGVVDPARA